MPVRPCISVPVAWVAVLCLIATTGGVVSADEVFTVHADSDLGPVDLRHGYIMGLDGSAPLDRDMVATLRPVNWRISKVQSFEEAAYHECQITYVLSDIYAWNQGGYPEARPWEDWTEWEQWVVYLMNWFKAHYPDVTVAYWDVWNEPDHSYFWTGTYGQLLELFYRTYNAVKSVDPDAKVVGPSVSRYDPNDPGVADVIGFLTDLDSLYGIRLDAVSWHENGSVRPEHIPYHVQMIRNGLAANFPPEYQPELHVNEHTAPEWHLSPGWSLAHFYYLEKADVDANMRACWWVYSDDMSPVETWSDCWAGLNGMFMNDGETPQPAYWTYLSYVETGGHLRLITDSSEINTVVLASRDDSTKSMRLIAGRYWRSAPTTVRISVVDYPYSQNAVYAEVCMIPHYDEFYEYPPKAIPLPEGPTKVFTGQIPISDGAIDINLESFDDGEVYVVDLLPVLSPCEHADLNDDGVVDVDDLFQILGAWGPCDDCPEDIDENGIVNIDDVFAVLAAWGPCP